MSYSFPDLGLSSPDNMNFFWSVVYWGISQVAPYLMILFAIFLVGGVAKIVYDSIHPAKVDNSYYDEEE